MVSLYLEHLEIPIQVVVIAFLIVSGLVDLLVGSF